MKKPFVMFLSLAVLWSSPAWAEEADTGETSGDYTEVLAASDREYIEYTLNLANNEDQEWTYSADSDSWVLSVVPAVAYPEIEKEQGVSVCVPGAYVTGIDTDQDGAVDVTAAEADEAVKGALVINYEAQITSTNGQVYTAETAPVILNTGAAGYGSSTNAAASSLKSTEMF